MHAGMKRTISQIVTDWRRSAGITQQVAAKQIGTSQPVFARIENGARFPDAATANLFISAHVFTSSEWASQMLTTAAEQAA